MPNELDTLKESLTDRPTATVLQAKLHPHSQDIRAK